MKKLETPALKAAVVKGLIEGKSQDEIAEQVGVHQSTVSRFVTNDEIKAIIKQANQDLLDVVPIAVENVKGLVRDMQALPMKDHKNRELSYKASKKVLESTGILPAHTQSIFVQQTLNQRNIFLHPEVERILHEMLKSTSSDDLIDVDYEQE